MRDVVLLYELTALYEQHVEKKRRKGPSTAAGAIVTEAFLASVAEAENERAEKQTEKEGAARVRAERAKEREQEAAKLAASATELLAAGKPLVSLCLPQLLALARKHGVPLSAKARKADVVAAVGTALTAVATQQAQA